MLRATLLPERKTSLWTNRVVGRINVTIRDPNEMAVIRIDAVGIAIQQPDALHFDMIPSAAAGVGREISSARTPFGATRLSAWSSVPNETLVIFVGRARRGKVVGHLRAAGMRLGQRRGESDASAGDLNTRLVGKP